MRRSFIPLWHGMDEHNGLGQAKDKKTVIKVTQNGVEKVQDVASVNCTKSL